MASRRADSRRGPLREIDWEKGWRRNRAASCTRRSPCLKKIREIRSTRLTMGNTLSSYLREAGPERTPRPRGGERQRWRTSFENVSLPGWLSWRGRSPPSHRWQYQNGQQADRLKKGGGSISSAALKHRSGHFFHTWSLVVGRRLFFSFIFSPL